MAWQTITDASSLEEARTARPTIAGIPVGSSTLRSSFYGSEIQR
jgi:hypothetical protein